MEPRQSGLTDLGSNVRDALQAEGEAAEAIRTARAALLTRVASGEVRRRDRWFLGRARGPRIFLAFAATAAVTATFIVVLGLPVTFRVGPSGAPGRIGDLVEAPAATPVSLQFSEGSSIVVGASGRLRVLGVESAGAQVLVESGTADVAIAHRKQRRTHWRFEAGPFHVVVTGTRFRVDWSPKDQTFALDLKEGAVIVSGACLQQPRSVATGESVRLSCAPASASALPAAPAKTAERIDSAPIAASLEESRERPALVQAKLAPADWRHLVLSGAYAEGLRAAERAGFDHACQTADEDELLALADAARLSGKASRAVTALGNLRRRFPQSDAAATAAFALGRVAFEQGGGYDLAARWFATYVSERPNGPLIGDAIGRLMEARQRAGDRIGARADAERYLKRFPEGPYVAIARAILAE